MRVSYSDSELRDALSEVPTPVTVITTLDDGGPHGTTVSAFCSLSARPPLLLVALDRESVLLRKLRSTGRFGVSVLADGQDEIARRCASKAEDKFEAVPWHAEDGVPRIDGAASWFLCEIEELLPGGDHEIVVGHVLECARDGQAGSLVYHRRDFALTRSLGDA
jgi:flavin reductase (DIM6/NTAB) family NADH-FMN oxidoreductase RutF